MKVAPVIRLASSSDVGAIRSVVDEAFSPYIERIGARPVPMEADYPAIVGEERAWVAELAEVGVCGVLVLEPADDHLLLDTIAVSDDVRGAGVGSALMDQAELVARSLGYPEIRLYTNQLMWENIEYYPRHGYLERERFTFREIYHRVLFVKSLG